MSYSALSKGSLYKYIFFYIKLWFTVKHHRVCFLENYFQANHLQEIPSKLKKNEENVMTLTSNGSSDLKINMDLV